MNKGDLAVKIAKDVGITKAAANRVIESFLSGITEALKKGEKVTLVGFGTFLTAQRKERMGRNPRTGAPIRIAGKRVPKFKPGAKLQEEVK
ncbi:MAG: HU family DNA-binding protein [Acidobacteria bacterium]|nr:HU family DNA-binding protein [Acidobacteriota bacterium]